MNPYVPLYQWIRSGATLLFTLLNGVQATQTAEDTTAYAVSFHVEQILFGALDEKTLSEKFERPSSEIARAKFRDPVWGRLNPRVDSHVFLVLAPRGGQEAIGGKPGGVCYAEETAAPTDATLEAVCRVLKSEQSLRAALRQQTGDAGGQQLAVHNLQSQYVAWLSDEAIPVRLFAAEALAKDTDLRDVNGNAKIATACVAALTREKDQYVRTSLQTWMWENLRPRMDDAGKTAIVNQSLAGITDPSPETAQLSLDQILSADPIDLHRTGIHADAKTSEVLRARLATEQSAEVRKRIEAVLDGIK